MMDSPSARLPLQRTTPACKRCSINKKKCDRKLPRCSGCVAAGANCEAVVKTADKRLMRQVEETQDEVIALRRQVADLQQELRRRDATVHRPPMAMPTASFSSSLPGLPLAFLDSNEHPILSRKTHHLCPLSHVFSTFGLRDIDFCNEHDRSGEQFWAKSLRSTANGSQTALLPSMAEAEKRIRSLVEASKHGPSNLDKIISLRQLQEDCQSTYGPGGLDSPELAGSRFRCLITVYLAICMSDAADAADVTSDTQAQACLLIGLAELESLTRSSTFTCVEALTLLCELAIHAPSGLSLWHLLGVATRAAIAIGLHRRDDIYLPTVFDAAALCDESSSEVTAHNQRRKDLFWALYSLDRLAAFILDRPSFLADQDIDVDVPPATMWPEGKYATLSSEALWVHHIQSRRLYGQIQNSLYRVASEGVDDDDASIQKTVSGFMKQVQEWYMKSRFNSTVIPFSEESIKRHVLDDIQYHQMVMALHQPCTLMPAISSASVATLYRSATLSVGLFHHAASRKQLNIHWVNLYQAFHSCATLIWCMRQHQERADLRAPSDDKVKSAVRQCREVLSLFRAVGPILQQYERMFFILVDAFESQRPTPISISDGSHMSPEKASPAGAEETAIPNLGFDMDLTFDPDTFPDLGASGLLDGAPNILSPTYWMSGSHVQGNEGAENNDLSGGSVP